MGAGKALIVVVAAFALFELAEHVLLPIAAAVAARRRRSVTGAEGMIGKIGEVTSWSGHAGWVRIDGELWRAESPTSLAPGGRVVVRAVRDLTLDVTSSH